MNTWLLRRARKLWVIDGVPVHTQRHNIRAYSRALHRLGAKWLLADPIKRNT